MQNKINPLVYAALILIVLAVLAWPLSSYLRARQEDALLKRIHPQSFDVDPRVGRGVSSRSDQPAAGQPSTSSFDIDPRVGRGVGPPPSGGLR